MEKEAPGHILGEGKEKNDEKMADHTTGTELGAEPWSLRRSDQLRTHSGICPGF